MSFRSRSTTPPIPIPSKAPSEPVSLDDVIHSSFPEEVIHPFPSSSFTPAASLCTPPSGLQSPRPGSGRSRPRVRDQVGATAVAAPAVSLPDMVAALGGELSWSGPAVERNGPGPLLAPPGRHRLVAPGRVSASHSSLAPLRAVPPGREPVRTARRAFATRTRWVFSSPSARPSAPCRR
eukprot:TRINITY_DN1468_c0_g1_i3.p2 TRINITY_DN1468_c0_g1~~TRINITY_DN1468_c0_g1_i3.p2  ORF type:complete len:179 (-),score=6.00 TRINITY_DN1468_c0_g1_i3:310-846(-)